MHAFGEQSSLSPATRSAQKRLLAPSGVTPSSRRQGTSAREGWCRPAGSAASPPPAGWLGWPVCGRWGGPARQGGRAGVELRALGTPATGAPPASAQKSWTDIVGPIFLRYVSQTEWCTLYKDVKALIRLGFFLHLFFNIFLSFTL